MGNFGIDSDPGEKAKASEKKKRKKNDLDGKEDRGAGGGGGRDEENRGAAAYKNLKWRQLLFFLPPPTVSIPPIALFNRFGMVNPNKIRSVWSLWAIGKRSVGVFQLHKHWIEEPKNTDFRTYLTDREVVVSIDFSNR